MIPREDSTDGLTYSVVVTVDLTLFEIVLVFVPFPLAVFVLYLNAVVVRVEYRTH